MGWPKTFAALQVRNYRLFAASQLLSNTGGWMQRVAQDWLVLSITNSPTKVGITVAMQFIPTLLFGLYGGVISDRYSKRLLLLITQSCACLLAATLAILALTDRVEVWHIYLVAFLLGLVTVVDNPTRQLFISEMVGREFLHNAVGLSASTFQLAGMIGPAISGFLINAVGAGWAFGVNTVAYIPVLVTLVRIDPHALHRTPPTERSPGQLREGLRYVIKHPQLLWTIVLVTCVGSIGLNMPIVLSAYAKDVFHNGATGYGLFNSAVAVGALAGSLATAHRSHLRLRNLVITTAVFGGLEAVTALSPDPILFSVLLAAVGAAALVVLIGANSMVQFGSPDALRGRIMSLYLLALVGGAPIGGPLIGYITEHVGFRYGMLTCGLTPAIAAVLIGVFLARAGRLRLRFTARPASLRELVTITSRTS